MNTTQLTSYSQSLGSVIGSGLAIYDLVQTFREKDSAFKKGLAAANLANTIAAGTVVLAPFAGLQAIANLQLDLAHSYFEKKKAKREAKRHVENILARSQFEIERVGQHPLIAARIAVASRGFNPEDFFPIGEPGAFAPYYNPRTKATDTPFGLVLDFGEGPEADATRLARTRQLEAELMARTYPAFGSVPGPFVRTTKGI